MKVNINHTLNKEQATKNPKSKTTDSKKVSKTNNEGNIYKEALNKYIEQIKDGALFRSNKFWIGVCVISLIICLSVNSNINNSKDQLKWQLKNLTSDITSLQGTIDTVKEELDQQAKINAYVLTDEEEKSAYNNAIVQGELVATLQNTYKNINSKDNTDVFTATVDALEKCFDTDSQNARTKWYGYHQYIPGTWEFASKASFTGNTAKVLWLCYADKDHTLLSYCTASYNANTKLFSNVDIKETKYLKTHIGTDDATDGDAAGEIVSIIDLLKDSADNKSVNPDISNEKINNDISESRESLKNSIKDGKIDGETYDPRYEPGIKTSDDEDTGNKDTGNNDTGNKDAGNKDTRNKDTGNKDTRNKDIGNKDTGNKDTGNKDGGQTNEDIRK